MMRMTYVELRRSDDITLGGGDLKVLDLATRGVTTLRTHAVRPLWGPSAIAFATRTRRGGRSTIGQNGDASTTGFRHGQIVRVPWNGGKRRVLLRHAMFAGCSG
jgi:hypothetical protein